MSSRYHIANVAANRQTVLLILIAWLIGGCASPNPMTHAQYLDETTGVSVSMMMNPMTFYSEDPRLAVNARDFASLGALEVNRVGERSYYLWLGLWSTIDRRSGTRALFRQDNSVLNVFANDRNINLKRFTRDPARIGTTDWAYIVDDPQARHAYYRVTIEELRLMADAEILTVSVGSAPGAMHVYRHWDEDKNSLKSFIAQVIDGDPWSEEFRADTRRQGKRASR